MIFSYEWQKRYIQKLFYTIIVESEKFEEEEDRLGRKQKDKLLKTNNWENKIGM